MKYLLLLIFSLSLPLSILSQSNNYHPFPTEDAIWRESFGGYQSGCSDYQCIITGDTLIGDFTYSKIQKSGVIYFLDEWGWCTWVPMYYFNYYQGAFRNDTTNRRVYFHTSNVDTLLYDFDLNIGDTLPITYTNPSVDFFVKTIDSILIGGEYRKRFGITSVYDTTYVFVELIEGIGSTFGLLSPIFVPFEFGSNLDCFIQDGETLYPYPSYSCNLITGIDQNQDESPSFQIYPNPVSEFARISFSNQIFDTDLLLFNLYGEEVLTIMNISNTNLINVSNLPAGIYLYRIVQDCKIIFTGRLAVL